MEEDNEAKQKYLNDEIIQGRYDPNIFIEHMNGLKGFFKKRMVRILMLGLLMN